MGVCIMKVCIDVVVILMGLFIIQTKASFFVASGGHGDGLKLEKFHEERSFHPKLLSRGEEGESTIKTSDKHPVPSSSYNHPDATVAVNQHQNQNQNQNQNHHVNVRHRRSYGLKSTCFLNVAKKCKIFTVNGVTKPYCVPVKKILCYALD